MKIDAFNHILPRKYFDLAMKKASSGFYLERRIRGIPALVDLELRFRIMDAFEEYSQVLTIASPPLELLARPKDAGELARVANDELAELVAKYPSRFPAAIAALPLNDIDASLEELERAVTKLGLKGAQIYTHINGKPLDAPEVRPLFEKIAQYDLPLFLHPARGMDFPDYPTEKASRYEVWHVFGWPYDSTVAVTRILFTGIFDQYPNLKIVTHHMGGMVPFFEERIRGAYDQFGTRSGEDRGLKDRLKKHPYEYYRMFYADTSLYGSIPAMECALAFFGSDHVVFATDMPFDSEGGTRYIRQTLKAMEGMTASIEDKQKIYESNIRSLLKM